MSVYLQYGIYSMELKIFCNIESMDTGEIYVLEVVVDLPVGCGCVYVGLYLSPDGRKRNYTLSITSRLLCKVYFECFITAHTLGLPSYGGRPGQARVPHLGFNHISLLEIYDGFKRICKNHYADVRRSYVWKFRRETIWDFSEFTKLYLTLSILPIYLSDRTIANAIINRYYRLWV